MNSNITWRNGMNKAGRVRFLSVAALLWFALSIVVSAQTTTTTNHEDSNAVPQDNRHDFDFAVGTWKAHVRKLVHPLTGSSEWDDFDGSVVTRSLPMLEGWNESEMRVDSPTSHQHIEILAVRLYNPTSHQWSIYGSSIKTGIFDPPEIGQFDGRRGEFYAQDSLQGRAIYIRFVWQNISPRTTHFEQAFSVDGGKTWETNWIYDGTRAEK
jgi:hypothetical protein